MKMTLSRMCVVSRRRKHRSGLVKITRINQSWILDENQSLFGRSIYLDLDDSTFNKFKKQQKRFKINDHDFNKIIIKLEEMLAK